MESRVIMNEVRSSADLAIVNECWLRRWTPSRAARAILSFQPVLERIQYLYFIIFWKKEWKLNRNIGSSKLNSPLSFFLFSLLSSFPFPFSFSLFFFCIRAPPAPKICLYLRWLRVYLSTFNKFGSQGCCIPPSNSNKATDGAIETPRRTTRTDSQEPAPP